MSNQLQKQNIDNNSTIPIRPSEKNFQLFALYRQGLSCEEIAKREGLTLRDIQYHIGKVRQWLSDDWDRFTRQDMRLEYDKVKQKWTELVDDRHAPTIMQYMEKEVYAKPTAKPTAQINVMTVVNGMTGAQAYDSDVIVEQAGDDGVYEPTTADIETTSQDRVQ